MLLSTLVHNPLVLLYPTNGKLQMLSLSISPTPYLLLLTHEQIIFTSTSHIDERSIPSVQLCLDVSLRLEVRSADGTTALTARL